MNILLHSTLTALALTSFLPAQSLSSILEPFESRQQGIQAEMELAMKPFEQKVKALSEEQVDAIAGYIDSNPEAPDQLDALRQLNRLAQMSGKPSAMDKYYALWVKQLSNEETVDHRELAYSCEQSLINIKNNQGREKAVKTLNENYAAIIKSKSAQYGEQIINQLLASVDAPSTGETVDLAFTSMNDKEIKLKDYKGKVVLIDFWATWCGPCVAELPTLKKSYSTYRDQGFEILGISLDGGKQTLEETTKTVKTFIKENDIQWENKLSGDGWSEALAKDFKVTGIPATFLIGKDGKIAATNLRGLELEEAIKAELAK